MEAEDKVKSAEHANYISIWTKAVETQMHFNEMSVKSRQLGLTFLAAALGLGIVLFSREEDFSFFINFGLFVFQIHVAVVLLLGAWVALISVRQLDLNVYHRMLRGAVTFGEDFEEHYMKQIFQLEKGMTQAVSHYSRRDDANRTKGPSGKYTYSGESEITAEEKIRRFYSMTSRYLLIGAAAFLAVTNIERWTGGSEYAKRQAIEATEGKPAQDHQQRVEPSPTAPPETEEALIAPSPEPNQVLPLKPEPPPMTPPADHEEAPKESVSPSTTQDPADEPQPK